MKFAHKIFLLTLSIVVFTILMTNVIFALNAKKTVFKGVSTEALKISAEAATTLSDQPQRVREYQLLLDGQHVPGLKDSIDQSLLALRNEYAQRGVEEGVHPTFYSIMLINDTLKIAGDPSAGSGPPLSVHDYAHLEFKKEIFKSGKSAVLPEPYADQYGVWISAYGPIKNQNGQVLALLGVDLPLGAYSVIDAQVNKTLLFSLIPAALLTALLSLFIAKSLSGPIDDIVSALEHVKNGRFDKRIDIDRKDEIGKIATAFNDMVSGLQEKEKIMYTLHQAVSPEIADKLLSESINPKGDLMEGTVLFADIRGFTAISESITARDTIEYINEFLSICVPYILDHGGIIEKFVGDEIFAVFGGPIPLNNDAQKAVDVALNIKQRIDEINQERDAQNLPLINIGIGICTGVMIGGVIGTEERNNYTLLGSTVNEGARICSLAKGGQILISQSTYLRLKNRYQVEKLESVSVKGKTFTINVFSVIRKKSQV